ncbi:hypothetical protein JOM56_007702, partial [Amanita muscaria]
THQKIAAWAATVQPGSPAPPSIFSPGSPSFISLTPPPKSSPKFVDLTALGYTTIFVQFPKTPLTASPYPRPRQPTVKESMAPQQQQRSTSSAFGRLRSLANIGNRSRSKSVSAGAGASSSKPKPTTESKKAKHAHVPPPPPLANELALMQFVEGGSVESHAKRVMKAQARAAAGSHYNPQNVSVGAVYRDDRGNVWWDEDEQYEYAHLLAGESVDMYAYQGNEGADAWVKFGKQSPSGKDSPPGKQQSRTPPPDLERRESLSTQESDLVNIVKPVEDGNMPVTVPGLSLLSVPMRARKQALRKPEFLVDVAAFGPRSPPGVSKSFDANTATTSDAVRLKGKARRRPAPLKIPSPVSTSKRPSNPALPSAGLPLAERAQREFIENSFKPMPLPRRQPVT